MLRSCDKRTNERMKKKRTRGREKRTRGRHEKLAGGSSAHRGPLFQQKNNTSSYRRPICLNNNRASWPTKQSGAALAPADAAAAEGYYKCIGDGTILRPYRQTSGAVSSCLKQFRLIVVVVWSPDTRAYLFSPPPSNEFLLRSEIKGNCGELWPASGFK